MKLVAALVGSALALCGSSRARAEAPGETAPVVVPAPGYAYAAARPSVMANRWSLGFAVGSEAITLTGDPSATQFAIGQLALRYRATLHLELEVSGGGGREQLAHGGGQGDLEVSSVTLSARYRFRAERAWNWYVTGGVGQTTVASAEASDDERKAAARTHAELGLGIERRFAHLALSAELRSIGVAPAAAMDSAARSNIIMPRSQAETAGALMLGASYYF